MSNKSTILICDILVAPFDISLSWPPSLATDNFKYILSVNLFYFYSVRYSDELKWIFPFPNVMIIFTHQFVFGGFSLIIDYPHN